MREVERDILQREQQQREEQSLIEEVRQIQNVIFDRNCLQVKTAWLVELENLVERISDKFSAHFASMGFAGQVSVYQEMMRF